MSSGSRRTQYITFAQMDEAISEVAELARSASLEVVLVGGCALQFFGSDRLTANVDFAADGLLTQLPTLGLLSFGGIQTQTSAGVPVDWVVRSDRYAHLYRAAISNAIRIPGVPLPVASPAYLAAMKMVARRTKDEADLEALIDSGELDLNEARQVVQRLLGDYAADDLESYIQTSPLRRRKE